MVNLIVSSLQTLNELLSAGIAITAFSLLLYALSFNLRDRVARSFAAILVCVVIVFVAEAFSGVAPSAAMLEFWLRLQWVGIIFLPATYLHLSDALLATTGRPSRGRRRWAVRLVYGVSLVFLLALPGRWLVGDLIPVAQPAPHLQRTPLTWVFSMFYIASMAIAAVNFWRSYQRTLTSASRRRFTYLLAGATAPALGSYPYLLFGFNFAAQHPLLFWLAVTLSNLLVSALLILMAYAVAFFGVPWPDRVVKRRLLKWLMRGPVTASTVLALTTLVRRVGYQLGFDPSAVTPIVMVASILILEHLISLAAPVWERWLFLGKDHADMQLLQTLDERILTLGDLRQFLETILAAVCDRAQVSQAFIAALNAQGVETFVTIGGGQALEAASFTDEMPVDMLQAVIQDGKSPMAVAPAELFSWGDYWLMPIYHRLAATTQETTPVNNGNGASPGLSPLLGLLGIPRRQDQNLDEEQLEALSILTGRAALALYDRRRQQQAFSSLEALTPQMDVIQRLRAATRYGSADILTSPEAAFSSAQDLASWVKDALTDYWGGPKLTQNPLIGLQIVQQEAEEHEGNPTNALRAILRKAIEDVRPEGERRFTGEWILYNILEMKFMEGRKVREIAMRLALSEADLYRKQRVAIEAVAKTIVEMEKQARASDRRYRSPARSKASPASKGHIQKIDAAASDDAGADHRAAILAESVSSPVQNTGKKSFSGGLHRRGKGGLNGNS